MEQVQKKNHSNDLGSSGISVLDIPMVLVSVFFLGVVIAVNPKPFIWVFAIVNLMLVIGLTLYPLWKKRSARKLPG